VTLSAVLDWILDLCFSEMSVDFQRTKRHYIPEDRTLQNDRRENLKSHTINCVLSMNCTRMCGVCMTLLLLWLAKKV
jgi:hypothetical protein